MAYKLPSLYAFSLPPDLLPSLQPRKLVIPTSHPLHPSNQSLPSTSVPSQDAQKKSDGAYVCTLTGASFSDLIGLKHHYKSDWYKYNVKLKLQGKKTPVGEDEFNNLVENLSDSISGSESASNLSDLEEELSASNSDGGGGGGGAVSRLLSKQSLSHPSPASDDELDPLSTGPRTALLWYEAPNQSPDTQFGIYRTILPLAGGKLRKRQSDDSPEILDELKQLQLTTSGEGEDEVKERKWTLLMFGGGHFAGMVVSLRPRLVSKGKGKEKDKELVILQKKTFHRYTTRRKQGGSQSANDNANGKAKSAGAQIRRHNEAALTDEVRELLDSWRTEIDESELIFLRCSKTYYKTFMGYDDAVLTRGDPRIRGFTFPTRRPTIAELVRSFLELTKVKTSHLTADALAQLDAAYLASITPVSQPSTSTTPQPVVSKPKVVKLTKLQELERDRWERLVEMVRKGKVEAVSNFLDKYGPELESVEEGVWGSLPSWMEERKEGRLTLLHVASSSDQVEMVRWLLEIKKADPTLQEGGEEGQQTPYEMARSKQTRNVFRFLTMQHPDWWDWMGSGVGGARVPSGLDETKEKEKEAKEEAKREVLRTKQREREAVEAEEYRVKEEERKVKEEEERKREEERLMSIPTKGPKRLGGGPPMVIQQRQQGNLTEEQKMRIQREERARAAEARLKRLG